MHEGLVKDAIKNITDIITICIEHKAPEKALVVYDARYGLTKILTEAYRVALPHARFIDFDGVGKEEVIRAFDEMNPRDLVVLIQSSNFLLDAFRIRLHLFQKKLKVVEHLHLDRNTEDVWDVYVDALSYDTSWYRGVGPRLKAQLEKTNEIIIEGGSATLTIGGGVETPRLNIGDYTGMENIGGTFPIGEVFTEGKDFSQMNGSFLVYAYAGTDFSINMHDPFRVDVVAGQITGWEKNAPQSFVDIINLVGQYERPIIREIGFGLNRAITRERYLQDITAFERIHGMHLSLGEKHSVYKKPGIPTHKTKFHIDLFPIVDRVTADGKAIFENGKYLV